jgi:hypothetical protein
VPPPSASYHPAMSTTLDEEVIVPSRVSDVVAKLAAVVAAAVALVQIVLADTGLAEQVLGALAVVLAAALLLRSWQSAACDARLFRLHVAAFAALMLAAGALVPAALSAGLLIAAALRIGRDVAGWRGLSGIVVAALANAAGLALHGADMIAPAFACGFLAVFIYGMAEPERGAWCACEWAKKGAIQSFDRRFSVLPDERPRRRP